MERVRVMCGGGGEVWKDEGDVWKGEGMCGRMRVMYRGVG